MLISIEAPVIEGSLALDAVKSHTSDTKFEWFVVNKVMVMYNKMFIV